MNVPLTKSAMENGAAGQAPETSARAPDIACRPLLTLQEVASKTRWELTQDGDALRFDPSDAAETLNQYVTNGLWKYEPPALAERRPE